MSAICGLSMAGLFTLLGELGCQHWTLCLPNTTVGNDKTPLCLFLLYPPCLSHVYILLFIFPKTPKGYLIISYELCHAQWLQKEKHAFQFQFHFEPKVIPFSCCDEKQLKTRIIQFSNELDIKNVKDRGEANTHGDSVLILGNRHSPVRMRVGWSFKKSLNVWPGTWTESKFTQSASLE